MYVNIDIILSPPNLLMFGNKHMWFCEVLQEQDLRCIGEPGRNAPAQVVVVQKPVPTGSFLFYL